MTDKASTDLTRFHTPFSWEDGRILDANGALVATFEPADGAPSNTGEVVAGQMTDYWEDMNLAAPGPETPEQRFVRRLAVGLAVAITAVVLTDHFWHFIPTEWPAVFQQTHAVGKPH